MRRKTYLGTKRTVRVKKYYSDGELYLRLHDIEYLLEIKQPFQFNSDFKKKYPNGVLDKEAVKKIKSKKDKNSVVLLRATDLLKFLQSDTFNFTHTKNNKLLAELISELKMETFN